MAEESALRTDDGQNNSPAAMSGTMDSLSEMVKDFLSTRGVRTIGGLNIVFEEASVEGSGRGVGCPQICSP